MAINTNGGTKLAYLRYKFYKTTTKHMLNSVKVVVFIIDEGNGYLSAFCPALNLAGQGKDEASALKSFKQVLKIFIDETSRKGNLEKVLRQLGWNYQNQSKPTPPRTDIPAYMYSHKEVSVQLC